MAEGNHRSILLGSSSITRAKNSIEITQKLLLEKVYRDRLKATYYFNLGLKNEEKAEYFGDYSYSEKAIECYSKAIEIDLTYKDAFFNRATLLEKWEQCDQAALDYIEVIKIDSNFINPYYRLALIKMGNHDLKAAIFFCLKVIELEPSNRNGYNLLFNCHYHFLKDLKEAINVITKLLEVFPDDYQEYEHRGKIKTEIGDNLGAIEDFDKAIELSPNHDDAYTNRGIVKCRLNDYLGAIEDFSKSIDYCDYRARCDLEYIYRAIVRRILKDYKSAIEDLSKVINDQRSRSRSLIQIAYRERGVVKYFIKDFKSAIEDFTISIDIGNKAGVNYESLNFNKLESQQIRGEGIDEIDQFIRTAALPFPDRALALYHRGITKQISHDEKGAFEDFQNAKKIIEEYANRSSL